MKRILLFFITLLICAHTQAQNTPIRLTTIDLNNFWTAYEKIISTEDSIQQYKYLKEFYLDKATPGLKSLRELRHYTEQDYIHAINNSPQFWAYTKANASADKNLLSTIGVDIQKLQKLYPKLKRVPIYFSVGAFRTSGTADGDKVLIGAELSLGDVNTPTEELPSRLKNYFKEYKPRENIALLCTHEYVHTQQKSIVYNLLCQSLYEGVAEFISCKATDKKSNSPAIEFGKANSEKVVKQFVEDLYLVDRESNWLWGENTNDLKVSDLGYFIGYEISERYYTGSKDKTKAVTELIELNYNDDKEVERIVNSSGLLPKPMQQLYEDYETKRPTVISITPFANNSSNVKAGLTKITVNFSEALSGYNTGVDFGPLGEKHCPKLSNRQWSTDNKSWSFDAELEKDKHYQILISNNFRKANGVRLKSYLIDFKTKN